MRGLALVLLLAGCASAPGPQNIQSSGEVRPARVTLFADTVTARMSDGTLCTGVRTRPGPWTTTLSGCPHGWAVTVSQPTERPRLPLSPAEVAPWVTLSAPSGPLGFAPAR